MKQLVEVIAKSLVDHPEAVQVDEKQENQQTVLELHVAEDDMGKVIGRQGRIAKAMRTVVKAAAPGRTQKLRLRLFKETAAGSMRCMDLPLFLCRKEMEKRNGHGHGITENAGNDQGKADGKTEGKNPQ